MNLPFRTDKYGLSLWSEKDGKQSMLCNSADNRYNGDGFTAEIKSEKFGSVIKIICCISAETPFEFDRLFLRLGIDCYMKSFPDWNNKFFPTLIRCEKNGLWGCFMSPLGEMAAIASPNAFISWQNEYEHITDVGHRIYTVSLDIVNRFKQPEGHPKPCSVIPEGQCEYCVYIGSVSSRDELYSFVKANSGIEVCRFEKYTLEEWETPQPMFSGEYTLDNINGRCDVVFKNPKAARARLFFRREWSYYLKCAAEFAEKCQQKSGTHTESWYGYFTMAAYACFIKNDSYTKNLTEKFDRFYKFNTNRFSGKLKKGAYPKRLQNTSCMISLLVLFYQLTSDLKYLNNADILANQLMKLQGADGAFYSHSTHYTCVIYPAKSMLDLALAEKSAGLSQRSDIHYKSAKRAIMNLVELKDNIQTEGDMTFEDGMISCEALQIAYLALHTDDEALKNELTGTAEYLLNKHRCLEQIFAPDARIKGCTLRFWEARYDINFNANMLNSPHGWTSWKTYATYYLYLLTGKSEYLIDTMDTMGACVQCIDDNGNLNWAYIPDPCIRGKMMVPSDNKKGYTFKETVIGEEYMPMISDWYRCKENKFVFQYIMNFKFPPNKSARDYGGSCDNDVNEHFKCMFETVLGKVFIHIENCKILHYGCKHISNYNFIFSGDKPETLIAFADRNIDISLDGVSYSLTSGMNVINLK